MEDFTNLKTFQDTTLRFFNLEEFICPDGQVFKYFQINNNPKVNIEYSYAKMHGNYTYLVEYKNTRISLHFDEWTFTNDMKGTGSTLNSAFINYIDHVNCCWSDFEDWVTEYLEGKNPSQQLEFLFDTDRELLKTSAPKFEASTPNLTITYYNQLWEINDNQYYGEGDNLAKAVKNYNEILSNEQEKSKDTTPNLISFNQFKDDVMSFLWDKYEYEIEKAPLSFEEKPKSYLATWANMIIEYQYAQWFVSMDKNVCGTGESISIAFDNCLLTLSNNAPIVNISNQSITSEVELNSEISKLSFSELQERMDYAKSNYEYWQNFKKPEIAYLFIKIVSNLAEEMLIRNTKAIK